jgi:hypothetical protein
MKEKPSSGTKQFLLTLLATTFSIILTFGTSAIINRRHKEAAKKEMVMMIIYDFDKTIEQIQYVDSVFRQAFKAQQDAILHPEHFNSHYSTFMASVQLIYTEFSETTEKVFSSNIETFNTLGNVNFIHEVSAFYNWRRFYQEKVMDEFKNEIYGSGIAQSLENLIKVSFPDHYINNLNCLITMKKIRNRCVQMMNVSEEDIKEFSRLRSVVEDDVSEEDERIHEQAVQEFIEAEKVLLDAREKYGQNQ